MKDIKVIKVDEEPIKYFSEESLFGAILPSTAFSSASIGIIEPGNAQTLHYHIRPQAGVEIIFIHQGNFVLTTEGKEESFDTTQVGPIYIQVPSGIQASIKNTGKKQVKFFSIFTPPFESGEVHFPLKHEPDGATKNELRASSAIPQLPN